MIPVSRVSNPYSRLSEEQAQALVRSCTVPEKNPSRYAVRDILRHGFASYAEKHPVSFHTEKVIRALMACGTGELGYTLTSCPECGTLHMSADKCGSRYCSGCGFLRQLRWQSERLSELIEGIPYYHVVFTMPHELNSLVFQNQKLLLNHLFRSVNRTVMELSMEKHKIIPGIQMVLHTFGSTMTLHYHIHMLVSGGGLAPDRKSFSKIKSQNFFLPVKVLQERYRSVFLQGLKEFHDAGKLEFFGEAQRWRNSYEWKELIDLCYRRDWNVEIRRYLASEKAAQAFPRYAAHPPVSPNEVPAPSWDDELDDPDVSTAVEYLSRYTGRSAITDNRVREWDEEHVSFDYKDYRSGGAKKTMTLTVDEFIRRFLLHILPKGVAKIRYGGFLAGCVKAKNLSLIRELLSQEKKESPVSEMSATELADYFYHADFASCPHCGSRFIVLGRRMGIRAAAQKIMKLQPRAS